MGIFQSHVTRVQDDALSVSSWLSATVDATNQALLIYVMKQRSVVQSHLYFVHRFHLPIYHRSVCWAGVKMIKIQDKVATVYCTAGRCIRIVFNSQAVADRFIIRLMSKTPMRTVTEETLKFFLGQTQLKQLRNVGELFPGPPILYFVNVTYSVRPGVTALESIVGKVIASMVEDYREKMGHIHKALVRYDHLRDWWDVEEVIANFKNMLKMKKLEVTEGGLVVPKSRSRYYLSCFVWPRLFNSTSNSQRIRSLTNMTV